MRRGGLPSIHRRPPPPARGTYLQDFLDAVDGGGQQGVHLEVVVDVIGVPDAHVEDVSRKAGHGARQRLRLQLWQRQAATVRF